MSSTAPPVLPLRAADALRRTALQASATTALGLGLAAAATAARMDWGGLLVLQALAVFTLGLAFMFKALGRHAPHARFGAANTLTLGRLAMISLLAGGVGRPLPADPAPLAWAVVVFATTAAVLDAADGPLARTQGMASDFGARFDMESDALLVLVLCLLVVQFGAAGPWLLAGGLMRYAFVAAARVWPWLARPLFASWRRKAVCVLQITLLIVCIGPIVPAVLAHALAALGLALLCLSFGIDLRWLYARRRLPIKESAS